MPCLYITTNVVLGQLEQEHISSQATKVVASIVSRPEHVFVMVVLNGAVPISFNGTKQPAAYAELIAMGGITKQVKRALISAVGAILEENISVPRERLIFKVYDTTWNNSKL